MTAAAQQIKARLYEGLIPAVPVPFTKNREIDLASQARYTDFMAEQPIAGAAVWVHTGRGLKLTEQQRETVFTSWRSVLKGKAIIAGVGGTPAAQSDEAYIQSAYEMALHAKSLGADAVLCYAPVRFREQDNDSAIIAYHHAIARAGLPMMLFYLYEAAGGISYAPDTLRKLFAIPEVFGIKMATLDSVVTYQNVANLLAAEFPEQLFVTGEDRFLGYSLMHGAKAALIGMGSAYTTLQQRMIAAYFKKDFTTFMSLSPLIDQLAEATFIQPMEGYIGRMLYILGEQDIISRDAVYDPWGPPITESETLAIQTLMKSFERIGIAG